jgi:hypothetical protein
VEAPAHPIGIRNFPFDPEIVKCRRRMGCGRRGRELLLHIYMVGVVVDSDRLDGIVVEDMGGRRAYRAKAVIATGDATVAAPRVGVRETRRIVGARTPDGPRDIRRVCSSSARTFTMISRVCD